MSKLWLTVMAFGTILAVIPSDATAQKTGTKESAQTAPAQPAAEWRKKRAVLGNVIPVASGQRGEFKNLAAKGDFSLSAR